ncbi:MAG: ArsR family transcriptional regulator [Thermoproteota archaeon]|nr:ArsR family transcriptional regulator [Thermoproteota archaeon]
MDILLEGPKSLGEITDKLQIQKSAVRVHLDTLQSENAVESDFQTERMGRPRRIFMLTQNGRELFPRKYDLILSMIVKNISETNGKEQARKVIESIADDLTNNIRHKIKKNGYSDNFEESLKIFNLVSNDMGFVSSIIKEEDNSFSLLSKNCILHRVALSHQEVICHGLHDRIILKSLNGKKQQANSIVELKECIAKGDNFCRHVITKS